VPLAWHAKLLSLEAIWKGPQHFSSSLAVCQTLTSTRGEALSSSYQTTSKPASSRTFSQTFESPSEIWMDLFDCFSIRQSPIYLKVCSYSLRKMPSLAASTYKNGISNQFLHGLQNETILLGSHGKKWPYHLMDSTLRICWTTFFFIDYLISKWFWNLLIVFICFWCKIQLICFHLLLVSIKYNVMIVYPRFLYLLLDT
jgi:hypothetical protein